MCIYVCVSESIHGHVCACENTSKCVCVFQYVCVIGYTKQACVCANQTRTRMWV